MLILFMDESGCDNLDAIDPNYPILGIGGVIFDEKVYWNIEDERIRKFKRKHFGTDKTILRISDIRKRRGDFRCLVDKEKWANFLADYETLIRQSDFSFISRIIDPRSHRTKYNTPFPPYELVIGFIMESFVKILFRSNEVGKIYAERRGASPDSNVRRAYSAIKNSGTQYVSSKDFQQKLPEDIHFYDKKMNSSGL